ncbi:MAG: GC-type dockerin domain-anchored protein [Phycisphaerales bacterium]
MHRSRFNSISTAAQVSAAICVLASTQAHADWPTDPSTPIIVGPMERAFSERHAVVTTNDQATWYAWQDSLCVGQLRVQRLDHNAQLLTPDGIQAQADPTCAFHLPPILAPIGDNIVFSRAQTSTQLDPVIRLNPDGSNAWPTGFSTPSPRVLGGATELSSGDTLIATYISGSIYADRIDSSGASVWESSAVLVEGVSSNMRIFSVVPTTNGGAYIFWDSPLAYTRLIYTMLVNADGSNAWDSHLQIVAPPPGTASSRHTDPVAISDHNGGALLVFTHGFETGTTPAPLLYQHILPDGSLAQPIEGTRISTSTHRQYFPKITTDPITGDLFVLWMEGQMQSATVRAQRLTQSGAPLWGEQGIEIAPFDFTFGSYDSVWLDNQLAVFVADQTQVHYHAVDASGTQHAPHLVGDSTMTENIRAVESNNGFIISWEDDGYLAAQRVNPDGRLGNADCNSADIAEAFGELDFFDISAFLTAFAQQEPIADFTSDGVYDFFDISAFLSAFSNGCS